ncbi:hypothetical protein [Microcoleus sp. POL10_C6]|uniref:hypothetical protein n=1 Tax=Microcoleus sp. POL10_C6 TaxID=2818852 RepID=UPI002FD476BB
MEIFDSTVTESEEPFSAIGEVREAKLSRRESPFGVESPSGAAFPLALQDNCDIEASQDRHRDGHSLPIVFSDAALKALQEDVVRLEKSIVQLKQLKQEAQKQHLKERMQHLEEQAERINALAELLATEMVKFQEMAQQVNRDCHVIHSPENQGISLSVAQQNSTRSDRVWEVQDITVPTVVKRGFQFVLTPIKVEKPRSEEADATQRAAKAQQRRKALEGWLEARRQRIIDNFSGL